MTELLEDIKYPLDVEELATQLKGRVIEEYSGRAMYGAKCMGVVFTRSNIPESVFEKVKDLGRIDAFGTDVIVYFPNIKSS